MRFVHPPRGNVFLREILEAFTEAVSGEGVPTAFCTDPDEYWGPDVADVVIAHEFFGIEHPHRRPDRRRRQRMIGIITEHHGTSWFDAACLAVSELGACFALNLDAVAAARARGLGAQHLQLGYVPGWDRWQGRENPRPTDITYMGIEDHRRNQLVASYGPRLSRWRTRLIIPPQETRLVSREDFLLGQAKWEHLRSSKIVLNLHRKGLSSTEWPRVVECMCNGAVVVTEHLSDASPLEPGEHYLSAAPERLASVADLLLRTPERLDRMRTGAYDFLREEGFMRLSALRLIESAESLCRTRGRLRRTPFPSLHPDTLLDPMRQPPRAEPPPAGADATVARRLPAEQEPLPPVEADTRSVAEVHSTPSRGTSPVRVSAVITMSNAEREVVGTLTSLLDSESRDFEVVVVDDASTDGSVSAVRGFLEHHPEQPATLYVGDAVRGAGWARNRAVEHSRGELIVVVDPGEHVYPPAIGRLVDAIDRLPQAAIVHPIVAVRDREGPTGLRGHRVWHPEKLGSGVDVMDSLTMIRRATLVALGGYAEDRAIGSLIDYDLWCRVAERGLEVATVFELLGESRRPDV
jgi:hypothetical protein